MSNSIRYIKGNFASLEGRKIKRRPKRNTVVQVFNENVQAALLWGDRVRIISEEGETVTAHAREFEGVIELSDLGDKSLLEIYFIDVGQGDGVLIRTPDNRHILIDAGFPRAEQPTGKNAADFVDWKFVQDYESNEINLDVVIASHNDSDHYGGLWDLLNAANPAVASELDATKVTVENIYHAGLCWFKGVVESRTLGDAEMHAGEEYYTQILDDRQTIEAALVEGANPQLHGNWAKFMKCAIETKRRDGTPTPIARLSNKTGYLPGFAPGDGEVTIKVLAPIDYEHLTGKPSLKKLEGGNSINTNGNSILLRLDYKDVRILLTGDLNRASQNDIVAAYQGNLGELACDVAKSCHHGSDDVSYNFLSLMQPAVSIISSGDNNGHDHPRPSIVGASAATGFIEINRTRDELISPLIYSTELARSFALGKPEKLMAQTGQPAPVDIIGSNLDKSKVECLQTFDGPGGRQRKTVSLNDNSRIVTNLIYGLVNVRTDGRKILCSTLNEKQTKWDIKSVRSRFR